MAQSDDLYLSTFQAERILGTTLSPHLHPPMCLCFFCPENKRSLTTSELSNHLLAQLSRGVRQARRNKRTLNPVSLSFSIRPWKERPIFEHHSQKMVASLSSPPELRFYFFSPAELPFPSYPSSLPPQVRLSFCCISHKRVHSWKERKKEKVFFW